MPFAIQRSWTNGGVAAEIPRNVAATMEVNITINHAEGKQVEGEDNKIEGIVKHLITLREKAQSSLFRQKTASSFPYSQYSQLSQHRRSTNESAHD